MGGFMDWLVGLAAAPTAGQAASSLKSAGPSAGVVQGEGALIKRYGTLEWVPAPAGTPFAEGDLLQYPQGGTAGGVPVGAGGLVTSVPAPPPPSLRPRGPIVSGPADFSRR